jgi:hypothetical protein
MNWKSYAAVSGATVLAGWLASAPPSNAPSSAQSPQTRTPPRPTGAAADAPIDIELQAMRLQARLRPEREYAQPVRDPFRFVPRRAIGAVAEREPDVVAAPLPPAADVVPPAPRVSLSGVAEDQIDGRPLRTAVLSSPTGVLIVREGEEILGYYRVERIESDAVELVAIGSGMTRRLALGASTP